MKCDELQQVENPIEWGLYYDKNEVDAAIDELKEELYNQKWRGDEWARNANDKDKQIAELEEERRWRKFIEEKPKEKQWILVFVENPSKYGTYIELRRWDITCKFDVENQELYTKWLPLPSAPKEEKK